MPMLYDEVERDQWGDPILSKLSKADRDIYHNGLFWRFREKDLQNAVEAWDIDDAITVLVKELSRGLRYERSDTTMCSHMQAFVEEAKELLERAGKGGGLHDRGMHVLGRAYHIAQYHVGLDVALSELEEVYISFQQTRDRNLRAKWSESVECVELYAQHDGLTQAETCWGDPPRVKWKGRETASQDPKWKDLVYKPYPKFCPDPYHIGLIYPSGNIRSCNFPCEKWQCSSCGRLRLIRMAERIAGYCRWLDNLYYVSTSKPKTIKQRLRRRKRSFGSLIGYRKTIIVTTGDLPLKYDAEALTKMNKVQLLTWIVNQDHALIDRWAWSRSWLMYEEPPEKTDARVFHVSAARWRTMLKTLTGDEETQYAPNPEELANAMDAMIITGSEH